MRETRGTSGLIRTLARNVQVPGSAVARGAPGAYRQNGMGPVVVKVVKKSSENGLRRSKRLALHVPVFVYGHAVDNSPFSHITCMLTVNAYGGLVPLAAPVKQGQLILLMNDTTHETRACRVVYIGRERGGQREVGIEFLRAAPNFWKVHFPQDNSRLAAQRGIPPAAPALRPR